MSNKFSTIQEIFNKAEQIANEYGWSFVNTSEEERSRNDIYGIELSRTSPCHQDYHIGVEFTIRPCTTMEEALTIIGDALWEEADSTDISYETYIWLDDMGHGKNGAPFDMKDCYEDMEWCVEQAKEVAGVLSNTKYFTQL